jgi:DNA-binding transcriptional LysR family regulator
MFCSCHCVAGRCGKLARLDSTHCCVPSDNACMFTRFDGISEFVAAANLGSFTAAAAELGVTKSAVGRAVSRLERRLSVKLLHRTTRRLTLTADGEAWLDQCLEAVAALDRGEEVLSAAQHGPSGRVRVDLPTALGRMYIMPLLLGLAEKYPALMLNVSFTDRPVDLIGEGIDLSVRIGVLEDTPDLIARPLGVQQLVICGSPAYLEARGTPRNVDDLANHDCIIGWRREHDVAWLFKGPDGSNSLHRIQVKHEISDAQMMLDAVRAGRGLAQLPLWLAGQDIRRRRLVTVLEGLSGGQLPINILWPRTRALPARVRVVIDEIARTGDTFAGAGPGQ